MQQINHINPLDLGREPISEETREKLRLEKLQKQKENGYQLLTELCYLGEYDAAKQLANRNERWGYEIVDGMVMDRTY